MIPHGSNRPSRETFASLFNYRHLFVGVIRSQHAGKVQHTTRVRTDGAIIIVPVRGVDDRVIPKTSVLVITQLERVLLRREERVERTQPIRTVSALAAADRIQGENAVVETHPDELVWCVGRVVAVLRWVVLGSMSVYGGRVGGFAAYLFRDQAAAKGRHVGEDEVAIWVRRVLG